MDYCQGQVSKVDEHKCLKMENEKVECIVQLCSKTSFVYTTRLEDMKILKKNYETQSFEKIVELLTAESKPSPADYKTRKVKSGKSEITVIEKLAIRGNRIYKRSKSHRKQFTKEENDNCNKYSVQYEKSGIEEMKPYSQKILPGMCKPLRVVLVDIMKNKPEKNVQKDATSLTCHEVLYLSSDDENDDRNNIYIENIFCNTKQDNIVMANLAKDGFLFDVELDQLTSEKSPKCYRVNSVDDFKEMMEQNILKNSLILIYNKFMGDVDIFEIDKGPRVARCIRMKCATKTKMTIYKPRFNIVACCWKIRFSFVALITNYTNYSKAARSMFRPHPCGVLHCKCCCKIPENIFYPVNERDYVDNTIKKADYDKEKGKCIENNVTEMADRNNVNISTTKEKRKIKKDQNVSNNTSKSNFIAAALRYPVKLKKHIKGNKSERVFVQRKPLLYKLECSQLFKLNHADGFEEIFELGYHNNMIGKIINDGSRLNSSWLSKTYSSLCDFDLLNFKEETSLLPSYISCFSNIDTSTKISFVNLNERVILYPQDHNPSNKEYTNILTQTVKDKEKFIYSLPAILDKTPQRHEIPISGEDNREITKKYQQKFITIGSNINDNSKILGENSASRQESATEKYLQPEAVTEDTTNNVRVFIDSIMQRFGAVRLTINEQGKVAAAFGAPVNYLKSSELKILFDILSYAQEEVDKLGLKPGTLNAANLLPHTLQNKQNAGTEEITISDNNEGIASMEFESTQIQNNKIEKRSDDNVSVESNTKKSADDDTKNQILLKLSGLISEKKRGYINSFRQYIGETTDTMPKISNVFSLNKSILSSDIESGTKDTTAIVSNNHVSQPTKFRKTTKNKIHSESTAGGAKKRKHQNVPENLDNPVSIQKKTKIVSKSKVGHSNNLAEPDSLPKDGNLIEKNINSKLQPEHVVSLEQLRQRPENSLHPSPKVSDPLELPCTENSEHILKTTSIPGGSRLRALLASKQKQMVFPTIVID